MTSATAWARSANISAISARGAMPAERESSSSSRMRSPVAVPPGWRVTTGSMPRRRSQSARRRICVDFPEPSSPSSVTNTPLGMAPVYHCIRLHQTF